MQRFSYIAPVGRMSVASTSPADRERFSTNPQPSHSKSASSTVSHLKPLPELPQSTDPHSFQPGTRFYLAFSSLAALSLVVALDGTSISVALPVIAKALNGSATDAFWAGTSFLLSSTVFQPIFAAFSQIFGRKSLTLIAIAFFLTGTLVAGTAANMIILLIGRSVQGVGGGGILALINILITDLVPLRHRGQWLGVLGAMWAIGSVSGPIVGGALAHASTWSWIFYLNLPFILTSFLLVTLFIRLSPTPYSFSEKMRRVDWIGSAIFAASMTSLLIPLAWGGVMFPWTSWRTVVPFGFGIAGFVILAYHELLVAKEPILRTQIFANRTTNIAYFTTSLHGMILWCLLYYQPLYFEGVRGFRPVMSGLALFPATFTVAPIAIITGLLIGKLGRYRWAVWVGWGLTTLGVGLCTSIDADSSIILVAHVDLVTGIGLGCLFPALQFQLQAASDTKHLDTAVAMFAFFRTLGQTLGIAIGGNIFQNVLASKLSDQPLFAAEAQDLAKDATALVQWMRDAPDGEAKTVMKAAFSDSLRVVYIAMACLALTACLASLCVKHYDLDRALETDQYLLDTKQEGNSRSKA